MEKILSAGGGSGAAATEGLQRRASRCTAYGVHVLALLFGALLVSGCLLRAAPKDEPSDEWIYDRVIRNLVNDHQLKTNALEVTVKEGLVTVTGHVANEKLQRRVSAVVKKVKGVKKVINEVTLRE